MVVYATAGSVSHGTMREEDLIPCFHGLLDELREELAAPGPTTETAAETMARSAHVGRLDTMLGDIERRMEEEGYYESEEAQYDTEALFDALNDFAPPGCYFGAHPGDGSDYGFWACEDMEADEE